MPDQLRQPSNCAAKRRQKQSVKTHLEFSKQLTIIDIGCWAIISLLLLIIMLLVPELADYCVNIFGGATAAYVSLRLGYTAKAGVENYKKISNQYRNIYYNEDEGNG